MMRRTATLILPIGIATTVFSGLVVWFIITRLDREMTMALKAVIAAGALAGVVLAVGGAVIGLLIMWERLKQTTQDTQIKRLATDEYKMRIVLQSRHFHNAPAGDQVYQFDALNNVTTPLHLQAGPVNGHRYEPLPDEVEAWRINQLAHGRRAAALPAPEQEQAAQLGAGLPPLLPLLLQAQRLIIGGGSDSGKSTLAKHLVAGRAESSQIIVIDPHAPSKILGFDVIGAGRKWDKIAEALESLELLMHERYTDVAQGLMGYFQHQRVSIFIDEWTGILEEIPEAGSRLKTLLTESRKVNMFLTLLTHSTTLDGLGLSSAQLKKSAMIVELIGGQGQPHRAFVHPQTATGPDGRKARPVEYALPGPFTGWPQPAGEVVLELPSPAIIKVQKMADDGMSKRAMILELFPGVKHPSKAHYDQLDELLTRAEAAKKARLGSV